LLAICGSSCAGSSVASASIEPGWWCCRYDNGAPTWCDQKKADCEARLARTETPLQQGSCEYAAHGYCFRVLLVSFPQYGEQEACSPSMFECQRSQAADLTDPEVENQIVRGCVER
jgi:hypothetical protein